jgi:hypothetical protein
MMEITTGHETIDDIVRVLDRLLSAESTEAEAARAKNV